MCSGQGFELSCYMTNFVEAATILLRLEVLIEKGSGPVSCDANRTKTVCRRVKHMNFFLKVNSIEL